MFLSGLQGFSQGLVSVSELLFAKRLYGGLQGFSMELAGSKSQLLTELCAELIEFSQELVAGWEELREELLGLLRELAGFLKRLNLDPISLLNLSFFLNKKCLLSKSQNKE